MKADTALIGQVLIALGSIASVFISAQKIINDIKKQKEEENEKLLKRAMDEIENQKEMIDLKIDVCFEEVDALKQLVEKDMENLKNIYSNEIKNLSEKVRELREEVKSQNTQIITLLTKMLD